MRRPIREFYNLVLDRWAIPGSLPLDPASIERGALKIGADDFMRSFGSMSYPAGHLFHVERSAANAVQRKGFPFVVTNFLFIKREGRRWLVARLDRAAEKSIDRAFNRHGVPVLNRPTWKPNCRRLSLRFELASAIRPPTLVAPPRCKRPRRNVPEVITTLRAAIVSPKSVSTPTTFPSLVRMRETVPCLRSRLSADSKMAFMRN